MAITYSAGAGTTVIIAAAMPTPTSLSLGV